MKRRQLIGYGTIGLTTAIATNIMPRRSVLAQDNSAGSHYSIFRTYLLFVY